MKKISLTGIKPTGTPHLGNYLGAIRPALELSKTYDTVYFIADYHALTTVQNGAEMRANIYKIAATWLALGLNPEEGLFYKYKESVVTLAVETDPVKFAKMKLDGERCRFWDEWADRLLEDTKPTPEEEAAKREKQK